MTYYARRIAGHKLLEPHKLLPVSAAALQMHVPPRAAAIRP
jgi:hypothetical protein